MKSNSISLAASLVFAYAAGFIGSLFTMPAIDGWYATLTRPELSPPNWIFGPVWTTLYTLMAIAAWRVYVANGRRIGRELIIYGLHLVVNAAWSIVFFGMQNPSAAFVVVLMLLALILVTAFLFYRKDPIAGYLFVPYIAWVSFASYLNFAIMRLN